MQNVIEIAIFFPKISKNLPAAGSFALDPRAPRAKRGPWVSSNIRHLRFCELQNVPKLHGSMMHNQPLNP